jgi:hypothetical protein
MFNSFAVLVSHFHSRAVYFYLPLPDEGERPQAVEEASVRLPSPGG